MIVGWTGLPGSSKTTSLAKVAIKILYRNKNYYAKEHKKWKRKIIKLSKSGNPNWKDEALEIQPVMRKMYSNIHFHREVEAEFKEQIEYWSDLEQLSSIRNGDVLIDEAMVYFDARSWEHMSLDIRRWLAQHRKFGIEIYFTAQEFMQIDIAFRRLVSHLFYLTKLFGSMDISVTRPRPKFIWGLVRVQEIDPTIYDEEKSKYQNISIFPKFNWISKENVKVFDTTEEIKSSKYPPLRHIERYCEDPKCSFHKTAHV